MVIYVTLSGATLAVWHDQWSLDHIPNFRLVFLPCLDFLFYVFAMPQASRPALSTPASPIANTAGTALL